MNTYKVQPNPERRCTTYILDHDSAQQIILIILYNRHRNQSFVVLRFSHRAKHGSYCIRYRQRVSDFPFSLGSFDQMSENGKTRRFVFY